LGNLKEVLRAQGDQSALQVLDSEEARSSENPDDDVRVAGLLLKNNPTDDQKEEARRLIRRAAEGFAKVAVDQPDNLDRRGSALYGYILAIKSCVAVPGFASEVDELNSRLEVEIPQLAAAFPNSSDSQWRMLSLYHVWMLEVMNNAKYLPTAERVYSEMIEVFKTLPLSDPTRPQVWFHLARSYAQLGEAEWRLDKLPEAEAALVECWKSMKSTRRKLRSNHSQISPWGSPTTIFTPPFSCPQLIGTARPPSSCAGQRLW
jgi:hypothetical protein